MTKKTKIIFAIVATVLVVPAMVVGVVFAVKKLRHH